MNILKIALASCLFTVASAQSALQSTVMTVTRSQKTCKDTYYFKTTQHASNGSTAVKSIVMTPADEAASKANMVGAGASAWPSTLTRDTHFTLHFHASAMDCTAGTTVTASTEDTSAKGTAASGVLTFTFGFGLTKGDAAAGIFCVVLKNVCTLTYPVVLAANWVTTTTIAAGTAADSAASMDVTTGTVQTLTNTKMTSATFRFTHLNVHHDEGPFVGVDNEMYVFPTFTQTAPSAADRVTLSMKGFTQKTGGVCSFDGNALPATTVDLVDKISMTLSSRTPLVSTKRITCTKIQGTAVAAAVPNGLGITFGTGSAVAAHFYADSPIILPVEEAPFSSAPSTCANVLVPSLLALVAATLLAYY